MWRGGLPPFDCAAGVNLMTVVTGFGVASQPNGGKPPRHKVLHAPRQCVAIQISGPAKNPNTDPEHSPCNNWQRLSMIHLPPQECP
ncbi:hypothetical protein CRX42_31890 [Pseudomonas jessenii]|uniref:Uncharacterized protein n=1 Tax=Pseudomonas jessenii TaxID=77298 RepID=A0A2W0EB50_PSEJE|nr:hypothetical protein CRX42_31890 [Pseudomonas jessenii]